MPLITQMPVLAHITIKKKADNRVVGTSIDAILNKFSLEVRKQKFPRDRQY